MSEARRKREVARADRILPGVWRLRLPLPWPGVPHVNAYAIAAGSGIVLVDTGLGDPGAMGQLERALDQAGLRLEHVRLLVCTHAHSDHYGLAAPIVEASGCELWLHPNHAHLTKAAADPDRMLERRIEVALQCGVPKEPLERYYAERRGQGMGVVEVIEPHRELLPGVRVETDLGHWEVYETPGHAPSHVVLHQPERRLMLSGDHLLGRVSLYYDYGFTPDPAGEFLMSLDVAKELDTGLVLSGHGRPFRDAGALIEANRREVLARIERVKLALEPGPLTAFQLVPAVLGTADLNPMLVSWGLSQALCYLRYLELREQAGRVEPDGDGEPERWALQAVR
ncbi:MAG TPA: MBL fold metallo-hydrolase [Thermoleophilaceae bacterium]|nr:MBL fold metallo-hydrolase [Thermoleophilaceae bacterium]